MEINRNPFAVPVVVGDDVIQVAPDEPFPQISAKPEGKEKAPEPDSADTPAPTVAASVKEESPKRKHKE